MRRKCEVKNCNRMQIQLLLCTIFFDFNNKTNIAMKPFFTILFFIIGCFIAIAETESQYRKPDVKHLPMVAASNTPVIDYNNGILTVMTTSNVNRVTVVVADESGATVYRRISSLSSSSHNFSMPLLSNETYTVTIYIDNAQYHDIIIR